MNEFEQKLIDKVLEGVHELEVHLTKQLGEIQTQISGMKSGVDGDHKALRELVERNIKTDTERLNKHSEEIDGHAERISKLEEWKDQFQKQVANRIAVSQSIAAVAAVVIAFVLSKFFS